MSFTPREKLLLIWISLVGLVTIAFSFLVFLFGLLCAPFGYIGHKLQCLIRRDKCQ